MPKRDRRRGLSRLPKKVPSRFRPGFPWPLDYRSEAARFMGSFIGQVAADYGGADHLTRGQIHGLERAAYLALKIVQYESNDLVPGSAPPPTWTPADYMTAVRTCQRLVENPGPGRVARDVPTLRDYLDQATDTAQEPQADVTPGREP